MRLKMRWLILVVALVTIAACESEPPLPTLVPTIVPTQPPPTATETATPTPRPTPTPARIPATNADSPDEQAFVRVVHAAPGSEPVDIYIEARSLAFNLGYGVKTEPTGIVAGEYGVVILPAGRVSGEAPPLVAQPITVEGGQTLILMFTGSTDAPSLAVFPENTEPLNANESRVTLIHAVPRGSDVTLQQNLVDLTAPISFGQISEPAILPSGETVLLVQSGTNTFFTREITLRERSNYTFIMTGDPINLDTFELIELVERAPGRTNIRFINTSASVPNVDIYLNSELLRADLAYPRATERQSIPTGTYTVEIYPVGSNPDAIPAIASTQVNANADDTLSLIIVGTQDDLRLTRLVEDLSPTEPGQARMTFINTLPDVQVVDVSASGAFEPVAASLGYRQTSDAVAFEAGLYDFYWIEDENGTEGATVESALQVTIDQGFNYLYILSGRDDQPVILGDDVGIINQQPQVVGTGEAPELPIVLRAMNTIGTGSTVTFYVDNSLVASNLGYAQFSEPIIVTEGTHQLDFRNPANDDYYNGILFDFQANTTYTAFIYGDDLLSTQVLVLANETTTMLEDNGMAQIRLLNFNQNGTLELGLAYRDTTGQLPPIDPTAAVDLPEFRRPNLPDAQRLFSNVANSTASTIAFIEPGQKDLVILDSTRNLVAEVLVNITIEPNRRYEVVTYGDAATTRVIAYVVSYALP